ncbi:MAG: myo-inosose-2 dehydratase [Janthinobacterium lividum]
MSGAGLPEGIRIGINPISWSNDDLPALGGETPLATALSEGRAIGYQGFELNGKFPRTAAGVHAVLDEYGLELASGWYSGLLAEREWDVERDAIAPHVELLAANGANVLVYGEVSGSIQSRRVPLAQRPRFYQPDEWQRYADKLSRLAAYTASRGVRLAYHHHLGAYVESPDDIDTLMRLCSEEVGLLFDSGHCLMGGGDPQALLERHLPRICHVHLKDVRGAVARLARNRHWSFPDCIVNGAFTVPGDGDIDFAGLLGTLLGAGYQGWLIVEAEQDPAVAPSRAYAKKGYDTIRRLIANVRDADPSLPVAPALLAEAVI